jgi:hypothetical protein
MNTEQLQNALKAAQEAVNILTELIEGQQTATIEVKQPKPTTFEAFNIYPLDKKDYPEVKRVLEGMGYELTGNEWYAYEDCVLTVDDGTYMTHNYGFIKDGGEPTYTFTEFMTKFAK